MIAQQRRVSKTRKLKRRTHYKITAPGMSVCPNCGELKLNHRVCSNCGYYNGKQAIEELFKNTYNEKVVSINFFLIDTTFSKL